jgi:hypothetical protein
MRWAGKRPVEPRRIVDGWALACLAIAPAIYGISAMTTNLNLGLRHVLPLYPFIFIGIALVLGSLVRQWATIGAGVAGVLLVGLAVEALANYPHYIAFFNTAAGGRRGGIELLGDSNLDWGQDLPLLRKWQDEHPDTPIYFSYFGMADPEYYGLRVKYLPSYFVFHPTEVPASPGVLAVSATNLQGIYVGPTYRELMKYEPTEVLGGTIYLYRYPLTQPSGARDINGDR